jgi:signal peptidase I
MPTEMSHARKPRVATALSMLCPGLGQIYCGKAARGLMFYCASMVGSTIIVVTAIFSYLPPMLIAFLSSIAGMIALMIWSVRDAKAIASRMSNVDYQPQDYNHPGVYTLMCCISVPYAIALALFLRTTVIEAFVIPSRSMTPTLMPGDRVLVSKVGIADATFQRGDVVVFRNPRNRKQTFVKRVIGLPGETVEIRDGTVIIDGKPLENVPAPGEDREKKPSEESGKILFEKAGNHVYAIDIDHPDKPTDTAPVKVADDSYFVLGDHRDMSLDSREVGTVPHGLMIGIVQCIYYPAQSWRRFGAPN